MNFNLYELSAIDLIEPMKFKLIKAMIENNDNNEPLPLTNNDYLAYQHQVLNKIKHDEAKNLKDIYQLNEHETKTIDTMIDNGYSILKIYDKNETIYQLIINQIDISTIDISQSIEDIIIQHKPDNIKVLLSGRCVKVGGNMK